MTLQVPCSFVTLKLYIGPPIVSSGLVPSTADTRLCLGFRGFGLGVLAVL